MMILPLMALLSCSGGDATPDSSSTAEDTGNDYTCGWPRNDPGDLVSTGASTGDVIANFQGHDQCGELVDLWDFHGDYTVIFLTAAW